MPSLKFERDQPRVLEIGCGTGACCCYFADRGFTVSGIDIEPKAIEMAQRFALDRGHDLTYDVADICEWRGPGHTFDLIVDGHCLEHIALDHDRTRVYSAVKQMMAPGAYYIIATTIRDPKRDYGDDWITDDGIVYFPITDPDGFDDAIRHHDRWYLPNRRHLSSAALRDEATKSGFPRFRSGGWRSTVDLDDGHRLIATERN